MSGTFDFCPLSRVAETMYSEEEVNIVRFNGWEFTGKPNQPLQRKFKVTLVGLRWYLNTAGTALDVTTDPTLNAGRLEQFFQTNRLWDNFTYAHEYLGNMTCRFATPVLVPKALPDSAGRIGSLEVTLVHANPAYT
jgi:hypothetical protein